MEIKIYKPVDHKVKAAVYGASGIGKTTFGATAPKPIFASAEAGLLSVADKSVPFVQIKALRDLAELLQYLQKGEHEYETVVIDSISEINEIIKAEIETRTGRSIQLADWAEVQKKIKKILRGFRDLPMHVLFISQEKIIKNDEKIHKITPELNGKAATEMAYYMDIVGYMSVDGADARSIITNAHKLYLTKDRSKQIGNECEVDFSVWVEKISKIKTGEQKVVGGHKIEVKDEKKTDDKELPPPPAAKKAAEPKATEPPKTEPPKTEAPKEEKPPVAEPPATEPPATEAPAEEDAVASKETEAVPMMRADTRQKFFACWNEFWKLLCHFKPEDKYENGELKFTKEKNESTRKMTMKREFEVTSSTQLNQVQAEQLVQKIQAQIKKLKEQFGEIPEEEEESFIEAIKTKLFRQRTVRMPDMKAVGDEKVPETVLLSWVGGSSIEEVEAWIGKNLPEVTFMCSRLDDEVVEENLI